MPTINFTTVGCRLNQAETATMRAAFENHGYAVVDAKQAADVAVVHTCTITLKAERECARIARRLKRRNPHGLVVWVGCAVEVLADEPRNSLSADLFIDQTHKPEIARMVDEALGHIPSTNPSAPTRALPRFNTTRALVKVQDGCQFFCSYCIVPYTRGAPNSRNLNAIIKEVTTLAGQGYQEIGLSGANIGCYQHGGHTLIDLIQTVQQTPGLKRLRISSIEPTTIEREIIDLMADPKSKLAPYLHLPLQSGSDHILKLMRRRYHRSDFLAVIDYATQTLGRFGLGTDVVTGFPGETDDDFEQTRSLITESPFTNLHIFPYSERPGTQAASMSDSVPTALRRARANELIAIGETKKAAYCQTLIGSTVEILVERLTQPGDARGWSAEYIDTRIRNGRPDWIGQLVTATVTDAKDGTLIASAT